MSAIVPTDSISTDRHQVALWRLAAVGQYLYDTMGGGPNSDRPPGLPLLAMEKVWEAQAAIDEAIKQGQRTRRRCIGGEMELVENWSGGEADSDARDRPEGGEG